MVVYFLDLRELDNQLVVEDTFDFPKQNSDAFCIISLLQ